MVIKEEESGLENKHGDDFNDYIAVTPRFFPKLSLLNEPKTYEMNPTVFKKDMLQTLWFVWAVGFLKLMTELHDLDLIPTLFKVY